MLFVNVTICQIGQWGVHCWRFMDGICFEHTKELFQVACKRWYEDDHIICEIDPPIPVNQKNNFVLSATDFENVNAMMTKI